MSLVELMDMEINSSKSQNTGFFGVTVGVVSNNKDPENLGRVKLKLPLRECQNETDWARIVTYMAGKEMGSYFLPEVGDEVVVTFYEGDVSQPIVLGSLWNGQDKPPLTNEDGKNNLRKIKSRNGNEFIFNDEDGKESIEIKTKAGQVLKMEDPSEGKITIKDKSGNNSVEIDGANNQISLKANMKINLQAGSCKIIIDGTQNSILIESPMNLKIKSQMLNIEGGVVDIKSDGPLNMKGAIAKIN